MAVSVRAAGRKKARLCQAGNTSPCKAPGARVGVCVGGGAGGGRGEIGRRGAVAWGADLERAGKQAL